MELTLECKTRPAGSKANALRRSGLIPAVLYGHSGVESVALAVDAKTAEILVRDASLNNTLIDVNVSDLPWSGKVLLREIQSHPWKRTLFHLSFFSIGSQSSLDADVPVHVVGEAPGVKVGGGSLELLMPHVQVRCAPELIPEFLEADVSQLQVGESLRISDLAPPAGVTVLADPEQILATILDSGGGAE